MCTDGFKFLLHKLVVHFIQRPVSSILGPFEQVTAFTMYAVVLRPRRNNESGC